MKQSHISKEINLYIRFHPFVRQVEMVMSLLSVHCQVQSMVLPTSGQSGFDSVLFKLIWFFEFSGLDK